jgi:hypothetical protein
VGHDSSGGVQHGTEDGTLVHLTGGISRCYQTQNEENEGEWGKVKTTQKNLRGPSLQRNVRWDVSRKDQ